ncbi:11610_t:CDS:2, partial [Entrophospora sp. SA101]
IINILEPGLEDNSSNKYPRISEHIDQANNILNILILIYFFAKASVTLILVLQIDEFQTGNYWTITLFRVISNIVVLAKFKTLIIPICTGTAPSKITNLDNSQFNKSPFITYEFMSLFNEFTTYYHGNSDILPEKNNRIYRCVVNSIKGIPVVIETACIQDTINTIEYHEQPPLIPKNDSKEFIRPELNRRCVEVICSKDTDIRGYQEIDATTGRYIIKIRRRCHSADAILSHADEQYKYSEALESGYLVHEDGLGEIDANDVKKEEVKTHATGAERLVIVTPKRFEEGDEQLIPRNYLVSRIAAEILDD